MAEEASTSRHRNSNPDEQTAELRRSSHLDYITTGNEPATPPYRKDASSSQLDLSARMPPEYRSHYAASVATRGRDERGSEDGYLEEKRGRRSEKPAEERHLQSDASHSDEDGDHDTQYATASSTRKGVHYPDTDGRGGRLHNITPKAQRFQADVTADADEEHRGSHSRAASVASSDMDDDDDDEMYDWSDEEDLVDEEAKFDKKMGKKKAKKGWGVWTYVSLPEMSRPPAR